MDAQPTGQFPSTLQGKQFVQYNPMSSAYGSDHPADLALGKARFVRGLATSSSTPPESDLSDSLHTTAALLNSGSNPTQTGPMTTTMPSTPPTTELKGTP